MIHFISKMYVESVMYVVPSNKLRNTIIQWTNLRDGQFNTDRHIFGIL